MNPLTDSAGGEAIRPKFRRVLLQSRLFLKLFAAVSVLTTAIFLCLIAWNIFNFRALVFERNRAATQSLTDIIVMAMRHPMMVGQQELIQQQFYSYRDLPFIKEVSLTDRHGIIRRSTDPRIIGDPVHDPRAQRALQGDTTVGVITSARRQGAVFESVVPVRNEQECQDCHAADGNVLGVLKIQNEWQQVVEGFRTITVGQALGFFVGLVLVALAMMGMLWRIVIRPVRSIREAMQGVAHGVWNTRLSPRRRDELGELAQSFNQMAGAVETSMIKEKEIAATASAQQQALEQINKDLEYQISLRGQAETALTESERARGALLSNLPGMAYRCRGDHDRTMEFVSTGAQELTGYMPEELVGKRTIAFGDIIVPEDRDKAQAVIREAVLRGNSYRLNYRIQHRDGRVRWVWEQGRPYFSHDGAVLFLDGLILDISDRVDAELALQHAAQEWRTTFDSLAEGIYLVNADGMVVRCNKAISELTQKSFAELVGLKCCSLTVLLAPGLEHCLTEQVRDSGHVESSVVKTRQGRVLLIVVNPLHNDTGAFSGAVHVVSDITSLHEVEQQQRLVQLGKLVGHMAHEINNPLMIISGRAQLAEMEPGNNVQVQESLEVIVRECGRARDIIQRLLKVSRPSKGVQGEHDLQTIISEVVMLVDHQFSLENVRIVKDYRVPRLCARVDAGQMQEVFINVLNNAREAMTHGGVITIVTEQRDKQAAVRIIDTGPGIPAEIKERIFEHFFTTKEHGTGLGLPICYGIMRTHQGDLQIESTVGQGTTVLLLLPICGPGQTVTEG